MSKIDVAFGKAMKSRRLELGISQEELAFRAGLHRTYISNLERGRKGPSLRVAIRLAFALEMSAPDLVQLTEDFALKPDSPKLTLEGNDDTD
ncbi:MAG: helix-turn-helix transcriptional regulator [Chloroflexi bacterium]|nr:helix-turn-helix transcriptional regulator [Chloroflexota bacterium]